MGGRPLIRLRSASAEAWSVPSPALSDPRRSGSTSARCSVPTPADAVRRVRRTPKCSAGSTRRAANSRNGTLRQLRRASDSVGQ